MQTNDEPVRLFELSPDEPRVEDGPIKFGDDWAGVFLRGDTAISAAMTLRTAISQLPDDDLIARSQLQSLERMLRSCENQ